MSHTGRGSDQFMLRLPAGLRDCIKAIAEKNRRSMNSEIVLQLERIYSAVMAATEGQIGVGSSAAASNNNAALASGASINHGK